MLLSAVSVLVVAQSSSEIPEGLMNNPVHSALLSFMQVSDDRFQAESGICLEAIIRNLHGTYQCRKYSGKLLMMGREDARNM